MERQVQLEQIVSTAISGLKASIYISMPGSIVSYDPDTQTASVQPMLTDPRRDLTSGEPIFEPWGVMQGVPVMWPRMGDYVIVGFLKPNDQVVLEAWDLDPSAWQEQERSQKPVNPRSLRRLVGRRGLHGRRCHDGDGLPIEHLARRDLEQLQRVDLELISLNTESWFAAEQDTFR